MAVSDMAEKPVPRGCSKGMPPRTHGCYWHTERSLWKRQGLPQAEWEYCLGSPLTHFPLSHFPCLCWGSAWPLRRLPLRVRWQVLVGAADSTACQDRLEGGPGVQLESPGPAWPSWAALNPWCPGLALACPLLRGFLKKSAKKWCSRHNPQVETCCAIVGRSAPATSHRMARP